jgi:aryl-alcohol dehydrogenase-like predicted oxidoreductase
MNRSRLPRRKLGRTDLVVSPLGLAAMSMRAAGPKGLKLEPEDVERAFHEFGVNFFFVIRAMKNLAEGVRRLVREGHRDEIVIASMANIPTGRSVRKAWQKQAEALSVDCIDLFLLGWVQGRWYVTGRTWPAMLRLREEGKVRAIGLSTHKRRLATRLARELDLDVLMIRYNAAHRGAESEVFEELGEERPGILTYTATRWGMLLQPQPDDGFPQGMTGPECYRFVLGHPSVDAALCAARTGAELEENAAGILEGPLSPERAAEVRRFGDAVHARARGGRRWMFR